ncbi:NAD-dependent epimerase/dehydratase family protein [Nitratidesulfovibrio sp. HK-II]|uniref:NAD-dependent epimerase/dehydratase family protein n=1 Tax=Nitratidesulfovibrio sp. HK-II TaxID=2009266 RepID=UPI003A6BC7CA
MHILILGGDGYLGWPSAMYFSARGHQVTVVDNYFRRKACIDVDADFLYPVPSLPERARIWHKATGREIKVILADLSDSETMRGLFSGAVRYTWALDERFTGLPHTILHYAEQPSAPYSLLDYRRANITLANNLITTNNLMFAVKDFAPDTHIIHIGTMGEYGTPNIDIEEGWLDIEHKGRRDRFLFPRQASSIYHTSKIMDTDLFWFGIRTWKLRMTDLMQGPVYGIETEESRVDERLRPYFNYDEIFGTVINRFVVQSVARHPLTVYGKGGQTRGYLNICDTLQCVYKSFETPANPGELRIFNQITETFTVNELAERVQRVGTERGHAVQVNHVENPRKEAEEHYYNPAYQGLQGIGVTPHPLTDDVLHGFFAIVEEHKANIKPELFLKGVRW